ncbi:MULTISPECIES: cupredoxin domain-containing protein [Pseudomonas]|jgi:uncharacterized cupredoxin-like copper-binding protein|uniref:Uncharacterized copper-binding protein, cupredoxin-like subfamily n=1 Tax=Pseudomonas oryzae TaxID=1392877 RepID=A0A1H1ZH32_9PSED|nr:MULTISPECIES: cupredoxin family protein [Pseudomonas]SDT32949.1 Uncharacterized copper-binding protein, cupredoxin-like subfamily [Pseudomonas oryzae]
MRAKSALLSPLVGLVISSVAIASPGQGNAGRPGDITTIDRTIEVKIGDMFFLPGSIEVKAGETVRFLLKNDGALLHEFNIGSPESHVAHQKEMAAMFQSGALSSSGAHGMEAMGHMGGMKHDDANSVLVEPGATAELVWRFSKANDLEFACNVPGHYQSGMLGKVNVH